ncbi:MAG: MerR family transcriptional regulator, partial [Candidatus Competibacteraceae bacterium]|nr:MerR family transcriptional regulator [Candidatus Competibacteraceae bacterium]
MTNLQEAHFTEPVYRIGAVARLTGISAVTIRAWERRHGAVVPRRTEGGNRLYSREDISRLALIRRLVEAGDAIGAMARLSLEELQERLARFDTAPVSSQAPADLRRLAVLGDALSARITQLSPERLAGLEVVVLERDRQRFEAAIAATRPELLVVERPTIDHNTIQDLEQLLALSGAQRALVIYGFGTQEAVRALDTQHTLPLRAPVGLPELRRICLEDGTAPPPVAAQTTTPPPRRFDNRQLSVIAAAAKTVDCEC